MTDETAVIMQSAMIQNEVNEGEKKEKPKVNKVEEKQSKESQEQQPDTEQTAKLDSNDNDYDEIDADYYEDEEAWIQEIKDSVNDITAKEIYETLITDIYGHDPELKKIAINIAAYLNSIQTESNRDIPFHMVLAGPTGSGKTEVYRVLRRMFEKRAGEFPIVLKDSTSVTAEGYEGKDKSYLIRDLVDTNGYGIVFIDEFDKRLLPSNSQVDGINFSTETQNGLLQMLDGAAMEVKMEEAGGISYSLPVDTNNTMFICMGAFEKEVKDHRTGLGFNAEEIHKKEKLTFESLIKWGGERQLIARFCDLVEFNPITPEVICKIIEKYKIQYENELNHKIEITESYKKNLVKKFDKNFGARNIRNQIWQDLQDQYFEKEKTKETLILE